MTIKSKELSRKRLVSYALLSFLTLTSTNDAAYIEGHSPRNQTTLEIPITTTSDRDSTFPQKPEVLNTVTPKQDDKSPTAQRTSDDLQSSSSESRRTAKSPLVLRLLEEQESTDNSKQLVYFPLPQLQPGPEQKHLYYQQTFQENEASVSEHADVEEETFAHKATGPSKPPRYHYVYKVKGPEGNDFGHSEARVDGRTWGHYFVQLPDGRQKTVHYWADDTGFHAEVEYAAHRSGEQK